MQQQGENTAEDSWIYFEWETSDYFSIALVFCSERHRFCRVLWGIMTYSDSPLRVVITRKGCGFSQPSSTSTAADTPCQLPSSWPTTRRAILGECLSLDLVFCI